MNKQSVQLEESMVTLPRHEYTRLKQEARAYRVLATKVFELPLKDSIDQVVVDFKKTDIYSDGFLLDLESGLRKSSYPQKYGAKATQKRSRKISR